MRDQHMGIEGCAKTALSQHEITCSIVRWRWFLNGGSVAKWQVLCDTIDVGWPHDGRFSQRAAAFGIFGLRQMAPARAGAHHLSAGRNLETLGHGLPGFNAFGTSHKSKFNCKRTRNIGGRARGGKRDF